MKWNGDTLPAHALAIALGLGAALVGLPVLALYRRIDKPHLFATDARRLVYEQVARHPGATATDLAPLVGFDRKTVMHHARVLHAHSLLEAERDGRAVRFFLPGHRARRPPASGVAASLLRFALDRPYAPQADAAEAIGVSRTTVQWHHRRLAQRGLLEHGRLSVPLDLRDKVRDALVAGHPWPVT